MTDRHTVDSITSDALDDLYDQLARAQRVAMYVLDTPLPDQLTPSNRAGLRNEIANALEAADYSGNMRRGDLADAIMPVLYRQWPWLRAEAEDQPTDPELRRRIATLEHVAAGNKRHVQLIAPELERAEAALARVRQLADRWENALAPDLSYARSLRAALAEPAPGPAATQPDPTHDLSVQHADALWDAIATPGPHTPTFVEQHDRVCQTVATLLQERPYQQIKGRCPACRNTLLFVGEGGHVTCSLDECPNPTAADEVLRGAPSGPAAAQATEPTACDTYQPPTTPAGSGLCARCGMYDYKHEEQPGA